MFRKSLGLASVIFGIAAIVCLFKFNTLVGFAALLFVFSQIAGDMYYGLDEEE